MNPDDIIRIDIPNSMISVSSNAPDSLYFITDINDTPSAITFHNGLPNSVTSIDGGIEIAVPANTTFNVASIDTHAQLGEMNADEFKHIIAGQMPTWCMNPPEKTLPISSNAAQKDPSTDTAQVPRSQQPLPFIFDDTDDPEPESDYGPTL